MFQVRYTGYQTFEYTYPKSLVWIIYGFLCSLNCFVCNKAKSTTRKGKKTIMLDIQAKALLSIERQISQLKRHFPKTESQRQQQYYTVIHLCPCHMRLNLPQSHHVFQRSLAVPQLLLLVTGPQCRASSVLNQA